MAVIIDGKKISNEIKEEIRETIKREFEPRKLKPGLVAILAGNNPASEIYVSSKAKACLEIGMSSEVVKLPETIGQNELINILNEYNKNDNFHGILVQQPLPKHIDQRIINETLLPSKDVDGFHPHNFGKLLSGDECFVPCTPKGIKELLVRYKIETEGKHVVIIGRSNIVGKPMMALMIQKEKHSNATVTLCHSATKDIAFFAKQADILIAAIGKPNFITGEMVKEGAVVIDVGINRIPDTESPKGYKIVGDVNYNEVINKCSFITPVPGGVGPLTIAMLLQNTLLSARKFYNI